MQATPTTYDMLFAIGWTGDPTIDFLVGGVSSPLSQPLSLIPSHPFPRSSPLSYPLSLINFLSHIRYCSVALYSYICLSFTYSLTHLLSLSNSLILLLSLTHPLINSPLFPHSFTPLQAKHFVHLSLSLPTTAKAFVTSTAPQRRPSGHRRFSSLGMLIPWGFTMACRLCQLVCP